MYVYKRISKMVEVRCRLIGKNYLWLCRSFCELLSLNVIFSVLQFLGQVLTFHNYLVIILCSPLPYIHLDKYMDLYLRRESELLFFIHTRTHVENKPILLFRKEIEKYPSTFLTRFH